MAKKSKHDHHDHRRAIKDILARFPVTGRDRTWQAEPVVSRAFGAAHRVFDKHFKGKLKENKLPDNA
jgi:hypothetical protein